MMASSTNPTTATTASAAADAEAAEVATIKTTKPIKPPNDEEDEKECYCGGPAEWCSENCKKSGIDELFLKINGRLPTSLEIFDDLFSRWREANAQRKLRGDAECDCKKSYCTSCVRRE